WFMRKEIDEQPDAIRDTLVGRAHAGRLALDELRIPDDVLREVSKVFVVACGSAFHAGLVAKYAIEHWTRLPVEIEIASEFRYRDPVLDRDTLVIAVSQSGETIDTLEAVRYAREQSAKVMAVVKVVGSSMAGAGASDRRAHRGSAYGALHGPPRRVAGRVGRRVEAQGDQLPARGRDRRRRDEARNDRPDRGRCSGRRRGDAVSRLRQGALEHPGGQGARRVRDRDLQRRRCERGLTSCGSRARSSADP